jgi:SIR2-like domain
MERAFREAGEPVDVVWYIADGADRGKFMHRLYNGELRLIENIKEYRDLDLEKRSLVLKLHGSVDRFDADRDSYVITEDDYIEYLIRADVTTLLPFEIVAKLYKSHFLFMGYGLRDWNLQVILHRIWGEQRITTRSWAIQPDPDPVDRILWNRRNVDIVDARLDYYIDALERRVKAVAGRA